MNQPFALWLERLRGSRGRAALAAALGLLAMLLILLSELWPESAQAQSTPQPQQGSGVAAYQAQLEQRLTALIEQLDGAGRAAVMVTLESGEERIYALDTQSGQTQSQQTHVLLEDGTALEQTVYLPKVCGVAVLCDGGGDIRVAARITEMVGALLDLPSNRICVGQRSG